MFVDFERLSQYFSKDSKNIFPLIPMAALFTETEIIKTMKNRGDIVL